MAPQFSSWFAYLEHFHRKGILTTKMNRGFKNFSQIKCNNNLFCVKHDDFMGIWVTWANLGEKGRFFVN